MATTTDKQPDAKGLLKKVARGSKLVGTTRGGSKGTHFLIQRDGRTLAMGVVGKRGLRVEGARLDKAIRVTDDKGLSEALKALDRIAKANSEATRNVTKARVARAKASKATDAPKVSGRRARSRQHARVGVQANLGSTRSRVLDFG